jgi:hypothetical protein
MYKTCQTMDHEYVEYSIFSWKFQGHVEDAIRKIKETLALRMEFEVHKIVHCFDEGGDAEMRAIIEKENETGKIYCRGYDREGRVAMHMRPHHENTNDALNNMRHLV